MHQSSILAISKNMGSNYSSIYNVIKAYFEHNQTNRSRNFKEKQTLLAFNEKCYVRR